MFLTRGGDEHVGELEPYRFLDPRVPVLHVDEPIQHNENLGPIVDVPFVGLVRPVQPHAGTFDLGEIPGAPRALRSELPRILHDDRNAGVSSSPVWF